MTDTALKRLAFWDGLLRFVKLPSLIFGLVRIFDKCLLKNFEYYIAKTQSAIWNIEKVFMGIKPQFAPELKQLTYEQLSIWRLTCLGHLALQQPVPIEYVDLT